MKYNVSDLAEFERICDDIRSDSENLNFIIGDNQTKTIFRARTALFHQFPPEIISTKLSKLLCYNIIQTLVVLGNVVNVAVIVDGGEVATDALYLAFLRTYELTIL